MKGKHLSEEHKRKIGESLRGKKRSEEARKNMSEAHKGQHVSEETKRKLSDSHKGKHFSEETKRKMSEVRKGRFLGEKNSNFGKRRLDVSKRNVQNPPFRGKHHSEESKRKISLNSNPHPLYGADNPRFGKHLSEEHKRKIGEAQKGKEHPKMKGRFSGEKNPAWNGGSSFLPYSSDWTSELKRFIRNRDNNECQNPYCDLKSKKLDIHHINYNKKDCSQTNLIVLCRICHAQVNLNKFRWRRFYKKIIWSKY